MPLPHYDAQRWNEVLHVLDPFRRMARQQADPTIIVQPATIQDLEILFEELFPPAVGMRPDTVLFPGQQLPTGALAMPGAPSRTASSSVSSKGRRSKRDDPPWHPVLTTLKSVLAQKTDAQRMLFFTKTLPFISELVLKCNRQTFPYPMYAQYISTRYHDMIRYDRRCIVRTCA